MKCLVLEIIWQLAKIVIEFCGLKVLLLDSPSQHVIMICGTSMVHFVESESASFVTATNSQISTPVTFKSISTHYPPSSDDEGAKIENLQWVTLEETFPGGTVEHLIAGVCCVECWSLWYMGIDSEKGDMYYGIEQLHGIVCILNH